MGLTGPATTVHSPAIMFPIPIEPSMLPVPCFIPSIMDPIPLGGMKCRQFMHIFPSSG